MEEERPKLFKRIGKEEDFKKGAAKTVPASDVLNAIADEQDIYINWCIIKGDLDISKIPNRDQDDKNRPVIKGNIAIRNSEIRGYANFISATFSGDADFRFATFSGNADFISATFSEDADFSSVTFSGNADFSSATFKEYADFRSAIFSGKAAFYDAAFSGDANFRSAIFSGKAAFYDAAFSGDADFSSTTFSRDADFSSVTFNGDADFSFATFSEDVDFSFATFSGDADFSSATFSRDAHFSSATFNGNADFSFATFSEDTDFSSATFSVSADFTSARMKYPANFANVTFCEDRVRSRLWNHILYWMVWPITIGIVKTKEFTDFSGLNTATVMDSSSNPYLKRYIDDQQWIASWRGRSWMRKWPLFLLWEITSHCGRSIGLWAFWSGVIAWVFAFRYQALGCGNVAFNVTALAGKLPHLREYFYYSIVTLTTLGFGDIVPLTNKARFWVGLEVVLGYVMLGGLISIFANKLARRS